MTAVGPEMRTWGSGKGRGGVRVGVVGGPNNIPFVELQGRGFMLRVGFGLV